jgi:hypothetical protein
MMPIREGAAENQFYSDKTFNSIYRWRYKGEMKRRVLRKITTISVNNDFSISDKFADTPFEIEYKNFIMGLRNM